MMTCFGGDRGKYFTCPHRARVIENTPDWLAEPISG